MENISRKDRVRNEDVLCRVKEETINSYVLPGSQVRASAMIFLPIVRNNTASGRYTYQVL
jgi:hypothetical protein